MNKPLSEWTMTDVLDFFEKHELSPQQIIPIFGSGALNMAMMASDDKFTEMEDFYRIIAGELVSIVLWDLRYRG